jgi:5'-phosphate synthase pdxT subunit
MMVTIGVLAVQGDFEEHMAMLETLGVEVKDVRLPRDLHGIDGIILPGGESTAMTTIMLRRGMWDALKKAFEEGLPAYGTCAGSILLAKDIGAGSDRVKPFGMIDMVIERNAYGRQIASREVFLEEHELGEDEPLHAVFIRAPRIVKVGPAVKVLATYDGDPVLVREGNFLASTFHPELTDDYRVHEYFVKMVKGEV